MVGLNYDNADNVVYQTRRFDRYKEVIAELLEKGHAYYCYCSKEELEAMREKAEKEGTATYDRRWRPEAGKTLPEIPADVQPVVRFKTPLDGVTKWTDLVKGEISIPNEALDDLIIARADGTPTYNFCVVVDDYDMGVTHVIRGDDHVNNTPKQINILKAIGANLPEYGHLPMILNEQGKKISKRSGDTVAITDFGAMGILPEAMLNYLARLGWAHGDDEFFTMEQFIEWFDLKDVSPSPSRMDLKKLYWINGEHIKITANEKTRRTRQTPPRPARHLRHGKTRVGRRVGTGQRPRPRPEHARRRVPLLLRQTNARRSGRAETLGQRSRRPYAALRRTPRRAGRLERRSHPRPVQTLLRRRRHQNGQTRHAPAPRRLRHGENPQR